MVNCGSVHHAVDCLDHLARNRLGLEATDAAAAHDYLLEVDVLTLLLAIASALCGFGSGRGAAYPTGSRGEILELASR